MDLLAQEDVQVPELLARAKALDVSVESPPPLRLARKPPTAPKRLQVASKGKAKATKLVGQRCK